MPSSPKNRPQVSGATWKKGATSKVGIGCCWTGAWTITPIPRCACCPYSTCRSTRAVSIPKSSMHVNARMVRWRGAPWATCMAQKTRRALVWNCLTTQSCAALTALSIAVRCSTGSSTSWTRPQLMAPTSLPPSTWACKTWPNAHFSKR